jgi:hypothetical protein
MSRKYLVTIDREEWSSARRWEFWKSAWHVERARDFEKIHGIGGTIVEVDRQSGECKELFQLPQLLDAKVLRESWNEQSAWIKSITRGLRAITPIGDGTMKRSQVLKWVSSLLARLAGDKCQVSRCDPRAFGAAFHSA